jgi:hypothetical protein
LTGLNTIKLKKRISSEFLFLKELKYTSSSSTDLKNETSKDKN